MSTRVHLYDTTLRDGAQTQGVDFSVTDKLAIAEALDALAIDYIEGGWPGANPTDDRFFAAPPRLARARLAAFGMTRRAGTNAANDPGLAPLMASGAPVVCLVGKTWDYQVDVALQVPRDENLAMIADSLSHLVAEGREAQFDAEHFFDGYKANPGYALACLKAAHGAGARWVTLCDTNGGTLPHEVAQITRAALAVVPGEQLGIHAHNDTENAVANSLAAVVAGARLVQGTINGLGERCGNANLISLIPTLALKMGCDLGETGNRLRLLTQVSRTLDERLNRSPNRQQPYVGESAFAHKGGLHVSAIARDPATYEHVPPERVGNRRHVVVSDQAGRANVLARLADIGLSVADRDPRIAALVEQVKRLEADGYSYDGADASFELLARRTLDQVPRFFTLDQFHVTIENRINARGERVTTSEAVAKVLTGGRREMHVAEGIGPVDALDAALRKVLEPAWPVLRALTLSDYKVRILNPHAGAKAVTRVLVEWHEEPPEGGEAGLAPLGRRWATVGVSPNIITASFQAVEDAITYFLFHRTTGRAAVPLSATGA